MNAAIVDRSGDPCGFFLVERCQRTSRERPGRLWLDAVAASAFGSSASGDFPRKVAHAEVASKGLAAFWMVCAARVTLRQIIRLTSALRDLELRIAAMKSSRHSNVPRIGDP